MCRWPLAADSVDDPPWEIYPAFRLFLSKFVEIVEKGTGLVFVHDMLTSPTYLFLPHSSFQFRLLCHCLGRCNKWYVAASLSLTIDLPPFLATSMAKKCGRTIMEIGELGSM